MLDQSLQQAAYANASRDQGIDETDEQGKESTDRAKASLPMPAYEGKTGGEINMHRRFGLPLDPELMSVKGCRTP